MADTTTSMPVLTDRRHKAILWGIVLLAAIAVRIHCWYVGPVISIDGTGFVQWAKVGLTNLHELLVSTEQEPVYPLLLGATARVLAIFTHDEARQFILAGWLLGTVSSLIIAGAIYWIGVSVFDELIGWLGALLVVLIPELVAQSTNVMTEPAFLAFLTLSTAFLLAGLAGGRRRNLAMAAGCGLLVTAAFLTRKEGMVVLPVYLGFLLLPGLPQSPGRRLIMGAVIVCAAAAGFAAYAAIGGRAGWLITYETVWRASKFLILLPFGVADLEPAGLSGMALAKTLQGWRDYAWEPFYHWIGMGSWPIGLAALAFFPLRRRMPMRRAAWLVPILVAVYLVVVYVHAYHLGAFVSRWLLPAAVFAMPLAATVIVEVGRWAAGHVSVERPGSLRRAKLVFGAVVAGFVLTAVVTNAARRADRENSVLDACRWLAANTKADELIWTRDTRIPFYLERPCMVPGYYTPFDVDHDNQPEKYKRIVWFVFVQRHGEESKMDEFLRFYSDRKRPLPRLVCRIAPPTCYSVFIYRQ